MRIILASSSPWRRQLLEQAGVPCAAESSGVDESACTLREPEALARELALWKARAVSARNPDAWVVGADQVMELDGLPFGKPRDEADHFRQLASLRGRAHALHVGVALVGPEVEESFIETTRVHIRGDLSDGEIWAYVRSGEGRGSAGGYEGENRGAQLIERVEGDWNNLIGLPVFRLIGALRSLGWRPDFGATS